MKHLTIEDFHLLLDRPGVECPDDLAEHLSTCDLCAATYQILTAPMPRGSDDVGDAANCPYTHDVYELFRDRVPTERLPLLGHHILGCEECGEFFRVLSEKEKTLPARVRQLAIWFAAAGELTIAATPYRVVNEYALAASGDDRVIETIGTLKNGSDFSIAYYPDKTLFRMRKTEADWLRVKVYADERWIEGWDELEGGSMGFELPSNSVSNIHLAAQGDMVGETILTMPYELLK
ncbi:MAG: hypothetical protein LBU86_04420 [Oscillospiraceae bacterium]|jgi:hypothetical protein|nr:hypothetical protein [Oscillospiraceae bacterium]